jgi:hypothetical protein
LLSVTGIYPAAVFGWEAMILTWLVDYNLDIP